MLGRHWHKWEVKVKLLLCLTKYHAMKTYPLLNYIPHRNVTVDLKGTGVKV
jgi:hypothetical protein